MGGLSRRISAAAAAAAAAEEEDFTLSADFALATMDEDDEEGVGIAS